MRKIESNIRAPVLLNLLNLLQKSDKMLDKPRIVSLFHNCLINSIKHENSCKILYLKVFAKKSPENVTKLHYSKKNSK